MNTINVSELSAYCKQQIVQLYYECMGMSLKSLQQQDIRIQIFGITAFHSCDFDLRNCNL